MKMKKQYKLFSIICVSLFFLFMTGDNLLNAEGEDSDKIAMVERALEEVGLEAAEIKIEIWGHINKEESLEENFKWFLSEMSLDNNNTAVQKDYDGFHSLSYMEAGEGSGLQIYMQDVPCEGKNERFFGFLYSGRDIKRAQEIEERLQEYVKKNKIDTKPGVTIIASIEDCLDDTSQQCYIDRLANKLGAEYIEGIIDNDLRSICYHSSRLKVSSNVGSKKVNLQIAARYYKDENKTKLYIGIPLIYQDY